MIELSNAEVVAVDNDTFEHWCTMGRAVGPGEQGLLVVVVIVVEGTGLGTGLRTPCWATGEDSKRLDGLGELVKDRRDGR